MINYVYLKNVAGIYNGIERKELELTFNDNKFNLICGSNGSGKSTIANSLDPFATESIRKDKKGQKLISITSKKNRYDIKHFYEPTKTGHSVKSYITKIDKNGVRQELNPNGNVTSFKDIVEMELGVSESSLQLFKLGRDLSSMISMTPSSRKTFMTKFTEQADIYLVLYKKISEDAKVLKRILDNTTGKLNDIGDIDIVNKRLREADETLNIIDEKEKLLNNELSVLKERANIILSESDKQELISLSNEIFEIQRKRDMYNVSDEYTSLNKEQLVFKIQGLKNNIEHNMSLISLLKSNKSGLLNDLNEIRDKKYIIKEQLDNISCEYDFDEIEEMISLLEEQNRINKKLFNESERYRYLDKDFLKKTIDTFNVLTEEIYAISDELNTFDLDIFKYGEAYDNLYRNNINKLSIINNSISSLEAELKSLEYVDDLAQKIKLKPSNCVSNTCPFLVDAMSRLQGVDIDRLDSIHNKLNKLNKSKDDVNKNIDITWNLNRLSNKIDNLFKVIDSLDEIIVEDAVYSKEKILKNILKSKFVFIDKNKIMNMIQLLDIRDEYLENNNKIIELQKLELDYSKMNSLEVQYNDILNNEKNTSKKLNEAVDKLDEFILINNNMNSELEQLIDYYNIKDKLDKLDSKINRLNDLQERMDTVTEINKKINIIERHDLEKLKDMRVISLKDRDKLLVKKTEAKKLKKYKKLIVSKYKDVDMMRKALSTKQGIPLLFVSILLEKTRKIANDILEDAFDNTIKLDKFVINEKEFRMPLVGKGDENADVSNASAGERSIISLALSLALSKQASGGKYNTLILDELDGPLDAKRRRSFLRLLDSQTKKMNIEQVFSISHNNMFDDYPVNLILLKDAEVTRIKDKNIIFEY